ncbi:MAG: hypothetical protein ACXWP5_16405, partial [Bdellovibrionota bacterium]
MTKGWTWGLVLSGLLGAQLAWADLPTHEEVWRDDDRGVVVYKDNLDADTYWYLPQIKLFTENGRLNPHRRELSNGNVQYTFDLVPYLSEDVVKDLTYRIPGLYRRDQLKPIYAKKFALQIKDYDVLASSQEVTNYAYLNKPQRVRLSLNADQDADFRDLFTSNPGVPVNIAIYYKSENVDKYLKVELTYKEVYRAMTIGGSAGLTFTKAQIAHNVSNYLSNKYLNITSKGAVQIPDIIETVLHECFTPVAGPNSGNSGCGSYNNANNGCFGNNGNYGNGGNYGNYGNNGTGGNIPGAGNLPPDNGNNDYLVASDDSEVKIDAAGRKLLAGLTQRAGSGLPAASPSSSLTGGDVMAWLGANASAEFQYKKELANNDTNFLYKQVQMADSQEVWVTTAY